MLQAAVLHLHGLEGVVALAQVLLNSGGAGEGLCRLYVASKTSFGADARTCLCLGGLPVVHMEALL